MYPVCICIVYRGVCLYRGWRRKLDPGLKAPPGLKIFNPTKMKIAFQLETKPGLSEPGALLTVRCVDALVTLVGTTLRQGRLLKAIWIIHSEIGGFSFITICFGRLWSCMRILITKKKRRRNILYRPDSVHHFRVGLVLFIFYNVLGRQWAGPAQAPNHP